ncbi:uncharacterized protein N7483_003138 [Penicillium malachiteum]|uniref:uncharacterized protein n=1 Tax=Penicillium malachiteum TaxID=1324776 RepID=UPI00254839B5|nr:uncharacterized protein N7483_003138 [Penicillium malachiteum]KAJ5728630.1 hypothetical protein N7483_003138 [Penicillium malachiteum]
MSSIIPLAVITTLLVGFPQTYAQTNITASACAASSVYSSCNHDVADKWSSCLSGCTGNGDCSVDCGCTAHQECIHANTNSSSNNTSQYVPMPPNQSPSGPHQTMRLDVVPVISGKVLRNTLTARKEQVSCILNVTDETVNSVTSDLGDLSNIGKNVADIATTAVGCACCGASASISAAWEVCPDTIPIQAGADLWTVFFTSDYPNLYTSVTDFSWNTCDSTLGSTNCQNVGFADPSDKFYKPGDFPSNGTSSLTNVGGTVSIPPSGTVMSWSQASTTWTVTATGFDEKAVVSQSEYSATATATSTGSGSEPGSGLESTSSSSTDTSSGAVVLRPFGISTLLTSVFGVGILL